MSKEIKNPVFKHILDDDVINTTENHREPTKNKDFYNAKLILQMCSGDSGDCLYDHLTEVIKRVLDERPPNVIDYFEEYSREIRNQQFHIDDDHLENTYLESARLESARKIFSLIKLPLPVDFPGASVIEDEAAGEDEEKKEPLIKDIMHLQYYWNFAGYGFPQQEAYLLSCSIRKLEENPIISDSKFWGKINGLKKNYLIVEVSLTDEEILKRIEVEEHNNEKNDQTSEKEINSDDTSDEKRELIDPSLVPKSRSINHIPIIEGVDIPPVNIIKPRPKVSALPKSHYIPPKEIPTEQLGNGVNRYVYFVCNYPNEEWIELPIVTPKQIIESRQIKKYLSGNLDNEINSFPVFHGTERHYLRALIARITSCTHISPQGYYKIGTGDDEEEEEVDEEGLDNNDKPVIEDSNYEPIGIKDLLDPSFWVHHRPNILKQGRVKWINPNEEEKNEEGDAEEEEEEVEKIEPETGPILMTPCSEDSTLETIPPWTTRLTSICNPKNAMVLIRSNLWPGAFTFALGRVINNLYLGWGDKFTTRNSSTLQHIPTIEEEYSIGPEVMEIADPTTEEEEAWRLAHEKPIDEDIDEDEDEGEGDEDDDEELDED